MKSKEQSFWERKKGWILSCVIPFFCFFAVGAKIGYWLIEQDSGRLLRDTGHVTTSLELLQSASYVGLLFGAAGLLGGALIYGLYRIAKRLLSKSSAH